MNNNHPAIIFDLDGTLLDSTHLTDVIWNRVLEKYSDISFRMTKEISASLMGMTMKEIGLLLFPFLSAHERNALMDELSKKARKRSECVSRAKITHIKIRLHSAGQSEKSILPHLNLPRVYGRFAPCYNSPRVQ